MIRVKYFLSTTINLLLSWLLSLLQLNIMFRRMKFTDKLNVTHKGQKYLPIIENIFHCITHFSWQILSFIHAFVLHMNRLKVDADYVPEQDFSPKIFGANAGNRRPFTVCTCCRLSSTIKHYVQKNEIYWQTFSTSITRW
jgi:hypothetical protein